MKASLDLTGKVPLQSLMMDQREPIDSSLHIGRPSPALGT